MFSIFKRVNELESKVNFLTDESNKMFFQINNKPKFNKNEAYPQGICIDIRVISKEELIGLHRYFAYKKLNYGYGYTFELNNIKCFIEDFNF